MKKRLWLLLFIFSFFYAFSTVTAQNLKFGKPTDEEMKMTVYEQDKEAAAVVLCQLTSVSYTMDFYNFLVDYDVKVRIKVLKDEGKEYADLSIQYINNENEEYAQEYIEDFKATAYNLENGKVVKTKIGKEQLFTERIDKDYMVAKVAIPQVKAGTVIEYEYRLHSNVFYHIYDWDAQAEIPVAYANYRLEIPAIFIYNVEHTGLEPLQTSVTAGTLMFKDTSNDLSNPNKCSTNIYVCTGRHLHALKKDKFVWNVRDYFTKVTAELQRINRAGGGYREVRKKWEQIDATLLDHPDFGARLYKHSKYQEELEASGISQMADLKEKVAATYKFLRQRLAWNGEYDLLIHSASEIVKKGNGSNADLNMMLINMLGDVGVKAYPVVMSTRRHGRLPQTYPTLNKLNTYVVGIPDGSSWIYVDASSADGFLNVLPANLYTDRARIIQKEGSQWVNLQKTGEARTLITVKASLSPRGEMKGEQTAIYSGNAAANERAAFREAADSSAFIAKKASLNGININSCKMDGHRDFAPHVQEVINFTRQGNATDDHIYLNPLTEIPVTSNPFLETERLLPVEFPYKQTFTLSVQLTLPDGWQLEELPKSTKITAADKSLAGHILYESTDEHTVTIHYQFRLSNVTYDKTQYDTLKQLFDIFANRAKDILVIKKA